jgi:hypothetical protein
VAAAASADVQKANSPRQTETGTDEPAPDVAPAAQDDVTLQEMRAVARAERLLTSDPERALEMTREMSRKFRGGYFVEDRAYLEVMALKHLGRDAQMRRRAAAFLREYPAGPYSARVRKALGTGGDAIN